MTHTVLVTGAYGNLGKKIIAHFKALGWKLILIDKALPLNSQNQNSIAADLSVYSDTWAEKFAEADTVVHFSADPDPKSGWNSIKPNNLDATRNVIKAGREHSVRRIIFASSMWVMAGYRFEDSLVLTTDLMPKPINPYGISKLMGEELGKGFSENASFIGLRLGYCQPGDNHPGPQMELGSWGQLSWLSNHDLCAGLELAVTTPGVKYAVLNMMSNNPGMRWDISFTNKIIGYVPKDGASAKMTEAVRSHDEEARAVYESLQLNMQRASSL